MCRHFWVEPGSASSGIENSDRFELLRGAVAWNNGGATDADLRGGEGIGKAAVARVCGFSFGFLSDLVTWGGSREPGSARRFRLLNFHRSRCPCGTRTPLTWKTCSSPI
jgi:hypothetical protein